MKETAPEAAATAPTRRPTVPALDEMIGEKIPVLDHGFVSLVDYMGDDQAIVQAASALGIAVRTGLHTGECEVVGERLTGLAVEVATRLSTRSEPGEILVTNTDKDIVMSLKKSIVEFRIGFCGFLKLI